MLTPFQSVKLEDWANHVLVNGNDCSNMPRGLQEVAYWVFKSIAGSAAPFPTFDTDHPYTFGEE